MPGESICPLGEKTSGRGTYVDGGDIKASIVGQLCLNQTEVRLLSLYHEEDQPELKVGSLILCRVSRIREDRALLKILKVDGKCFNGNLEGVLKKQNIRLHEIDRIRMDESFRPGDVVLARMISLGDSRTVLLSTAEDNLGVLFAVNGESGRLMVPISFDEMLCLETGLREKRVAARPDFMKLRSLKLNN
jgi:exosome complex component CSL4